MRTSKWLKMAGIGLALLLIPRRSSRKDIIRPTDNPQQTRDRKNQATKTHDNRKTRNTSKPDKN